MSDVLSVLAQLLHVALMVAAAPALAGVERALAALISGAPVPSPLRPWRDLARLSRKQAMTVETASWLFRAAPAAGFGLTVLAAALVPSFVLGMALAPWSDLLTVAALLTLAHLTLLLAALDAGSGRAGAAVAERMRWEVAAWVVLLPAVMALALLAGSTNLDQIVTTQQEALPAPHAAAALVCVGLLAVALTDGGGDRAALDQDYAGLDLAVLNGTAALRRLVWLNLAGLVFLPVGIAPPEAGLATWVIGLTGWAARLGVLVAVLAAVRVVIGRLPVRWMPRILGLAGLLGAIAVILALSRAGAA